MELNHEHRHAFLTAGLWKKSALTEFEHRQPCLSISDFEPLARLEVPYQSLRQDLNLQRPDVSDLTFGLVYHADDLDALSVSSTADKIETLAVSKSDDFWALPPPARNKQSPYCLRSWASFYSQCFSEPGGTYLSEQGAQVFDALLAAQSGGNVLVIHSAAFLHCLRQLSLGRESALFLYDTDLGTFCCRLDEARVSGSSLESSRHVVAQVGQQGTQLRELREFVERLHSFDMNSATLVALAAEILVVVSTLEEQLLATVMSARSLLQSSSGSEPPRRVISFLASVVQAVKNIGDEAQILTIIFDIVRNAEHESQEVKRLSFQLLDASSQPWRSALSSWLGLTCGLLPGAQSHSFVVQGGSKNEYLVDVPSDTLLDVVPQLLDRPAFISSEDARRMFETGNNLRLLGAHEPEHPLVKRTNFEFENTSLRWQLSWDGVKNSIFRVKEYEHAVRKVIEHYHSPIRSSPMQMIPTQMGAPAQQSFTSALNQTWDLQDRFHTSIESQLHLLEADSASRTHDGVPGITQEGCTPDIFAPPVSLLPIISFQPIVAAQACLVDMACVRMLFKGHGLRAHLFLLHQYHLFGDSTFAIRLGNALFDPAREPAARRQGRHHFGRTGLKLGYRDTWPPTDSELRLALMGILLESFHLTEFLPPSSRYRDDLPGGISFAIRPMSEVELQRCADPNSIAALDFLRLHYQPPSPINEIITSTSLMKYDTIFNLLLRVERMNHVARQLVLDRKLFKIADSSSRSKSLRFRWEIQHFVSAITSYFYEGIACFGGHLETRLANTEQALIHENNITEESISSLRAFHEQLLDQMMLSLLLRKRHAVVMNLVEGIFGLILQYVEYSRAAHLGSDDSSFIRLYKTFQEKVKLIIGVCRGLRERRGEAGTKGSISNSATHMEGENTLAHLLLRLEMNSFYCEDDGLKR